MTSHSTASDSTPRVPAPEEKAPGLTASSPGSAQAAEWPYRDIDPRTGRLRPISGEELQARREEYEKRLAEIDAEDDTPEEVYDEIMRSFEAKDVAMASRLRAHGFIPPGGSEDSSFMPRISPLDESEADPAGRAVLESIVAAHGRTTNMKRTPGPLAGRARCADDLVQPPRRRRPLPRRAADHAVRPRDLRWDRLPGLLDLLPADADRFGRGPRFAPARRLGADRSSTTAGNWPSIRTASPTTSSPAWPRGSSPTRSSRSRPSAA